MSLTDFYRSILQDYLDKEKPIVSFISGIPIYIPVSGNFMHILAKGQGKYPEYKFSRPNVVLGTEFEHHLFDNGTEDQRQRYAAEMALKGVTVDWQKLYDLRDELKLKYPSK
jgi:hypothetical protein